MKFSRVFIHQCRSTLLRGVNRRRMTSTVKPPQCCDQLPVFVIASPADMHLAPLAVLFGNPRIRHTILGNGLSTSDIDWLGQQAPGVPVVRLKASLRDNAKTYLAHAEVVRLCAMAVAGDFAIQDADCFVMNGEWWNQLGFTSDRQYAVGPFGKPMNQLGVMMPDTYLVLINNASYRSREADGIHPDIAGQPAPALRKLLRVHGISEAYFPDDVKNYYDTLQMHWAAAALAGAEFRELPGANEFVVHVGGSTYLNDRPCDDLSHWDFWPLNTPYFHMRVLEFPRFAYVRPRFAGIFQRFGSAARILADYPEFRKSGRYELSEKMLDDFLPFLEING
jgi:hypothetical protein